MHTGGLQCKQVSIQYITSLQNDDKVSCPRSIIVQGVVQAAFGPGEAHRLGTEGCEPHTGPRARGYVRFSEPGHPVALGYTKGLSEEWNKYSLESLIISLGGMLMIVLAFARAHTHNNAHIKTHIPVHIKSQTNIRTQSLTAFWRSNILHVEVKHL